MRKLWWRCAGWRKTGRLTLDVEFRSQVKSGRAKQKRSRNHVRPRNADVRGRQRTLPIRRLVIVRIVLVRPAGIGVVFCVSLVNQLEVLQQRM